jgi:hypothetical protein
MMTNSANRCGKYAPAIEITSYVSPSDLDPDKPKISPEIL